MKILYGGSFNPPTVAHYLIAKHLLDKYPNSEIIFLATGNYYNKVDLIDAHHRIKMLELLAKGLGPRAIVSDFEAYQEQFLGTYETLKHFNHPYFLLGADNLVDIDKWINYEALIKENKFLVIPRDDIDLDKLFTTKTILNNYKDNFIIIDDLEKIDISSSMYRKNRKGSILLDEVNEYIKNNNLYGG